MIPTDGLPARRRVALAFRWVWRGLTAPRYPLIIVLLLLAGCVVAIGALSVGIVRILERLEARSTYSECVTDAQVEYETVIGDVLDLSLNPVEGTKEEVATLRREMAAATAGLRAIDLPEAEGGCPGQAREQP